MKRKKIRTLIIYFIFANFFFFQLDNFNVFMTHFKINFMIIFFLKVIYIIMYGYQKHLLLLFKHKFCKSLL